MGGITPLSHHCQSFRTPPITYYGFSILNQIGTELNLSTPSINRVLIITNDDVRKLGFLQSVEEQLDPNIQTDIYSNIVGGVTKEQIMRVLSRIQRFNPEVIIAIGDGLVIDIGKICCLLYDSKQEKPLESYYVTNSNDVLTMRRSNYERQKIQKFICISTMCGSGSEMTPYAFVRDSSIKKPMKIIISSAMIPDISIIDSFYIAEVPNDLLVQGGFDVLVKALESLVSPVSNDCTQSMSTRAAKLVFKNLEESVSTGRAEYRSAIHDASCIAGMAMANTSLGPIHTIGNALQTMIAYEGIQQSIWRSILLIEVMKFNSHDERALHLYAELAVGLGLADNSMKEKESFSCLINRIQQLKASLSLPSSIRDTGFSGEIHLNEVVKSSMDLLEIFTQNPRPVTKKDVERLLSSL